jgi:hypothetical protein
LAPEPAGRLTQRRRACSAPASDGTGLGSTSCTRTGGVSFFPPTHLGRQCSDTRSVFTALVPESRLKAAREHRELRIDDATVDAELAWEARAEAERAVESAEVAAAAAVERLLSERLSVKDVVQLTGLDQPNVRRLRQARAALEAAPATPEPAARDERWRPERRVTSGSRRHELLHASGDERSQQDLIGRSADARRPRRRRR